jgi:hypothetical protein
MIASGNASAPEKPVSMTQRTSNVRPPGPKSQTDSVASRSALTMPRIKRPLPPVFRQARKPWCSRCAGRRRRRSAGVRNFVSALSSIQSRRDG